LSFFSRFNQNFFSIYVIEESLWKKKQFWGILYIFLSSVGVCICASVCQHERFIRAWDKWQTAEISAKSEGHESGGVEVGFGSLWGAKWDRRVGRVRFNSDSDVSVGHVDWQAFGATVHPLSSSFSSRTACDKKRGGRGSRATWRADNVGEMCTGIIFPGKCGVIEKKERKSRGEGGGRDACSRVIRTLFCGGERASSTDGKRRRIRFYLMLLDENESNDWRLLRKNQASSQILPVKFRSVAFQWSGNGWRCLTSVGNCAVIRNCNCSQQ